MGALNGAQRLNGLNWVSGGLYFGICAAPQSHRIITALFCEAGAAQEIAERSKKSRTAGPTVGRVFGKRVHETPMGLSEGVIG